MTSWIRQGTASVENGSTSVTGTLTLWNNQVMAGDLFRFLGEAEIYEVASDADGNNAFEIARPYAGESKSGAPYEIIPVSPRRSETPELVHRVNTYLNSVTTLVTVSGKPSDSFGANGWLAIDQAANLMYRKTDGAWDDGLSMRGGDRYDVFVEDPDRPISGEALVKAPFTTEVVFAAGLPDSKARADVAATADAVFSIQKNGVEFATCTFGEGSATGVFACPEAVVLDPESDDELSIVAPDPMDTTLRRPRITLSGFRTAT